MSDIVIKSENLGKKYTIGHQAERGNYIALRDVLMQNARSLGIRLKIWHLSPTLSLEIVLTFASC
jgi:lipopolysaccharide transport system ATP-binding protein